MKAGAKATRESVFAACDAIADEGRIPTVREICSRTGGSLSTIGPLRDQWTAKFVAQVQRGRQAGLPEEVVRAFSGLWQAAVAEASKQLDSARVELRVDAEGIQERVTRAEAEAERVSAQSAETKRELDAARAQIEVLNDELSRRATEHRIVFTSLTSLIDSLKDQGRRFADDHSEVVSRMTTERERLVAELGAHQQEIARVKALQAGSS
jgi:septal ring factor EnvC (AmiA/AmiB activator)